MSKRYKSLFLASWYPNKDNPIFGTFIQEHAKAVQLFDDVVVLHHDGWQPNLPKRWVINKENNLDYSLSIPTYHLQWRLSRIPRFTYLYFLIANLAALRYFIQNSFYPDVIHAHVYTAGIPAILLGRLYNIPVVITEHSTAFPKQQLSLGEIRKARFAFQHAQKVTTVSRSLKNAIEALEIHGNFQIISNTVDQELFFPANPPQKVGFQKRLLFVNHLITVKGLGDLLTSLSILNLHRDDWQLDIVGDGPQKYEYEQMIESFGFENKITFFGYQPKRKIPEIMRQSNIFILPSHVETFSVVTAEALSCGLPVIVTNCGGPEEFVTSIVGRVIPVGAPEVLTRELDWMMDHLDEFPSGKIREYAQSLFGLESVGAQFHSLYESLMN